MAESWRGRPETREARRTDRLVLASFYVLLARPEGFEPPTPWSEATCSSPLSYGRVLTRDESGVSEGIRTPDLQGHNLAR